MMSTLPKFVIAFLLMMPAAAASKDLRLRGTAERKLSSSHLPSRIGGLLTIDGTWQGWSGLINQRGSDSDIANGLQWKTVEGPTGADFFAASDGAEHIYWVKDGTSLWYMNGIGAEPQEIRENLGADIIALSADGSVLYALSFSGGPIWKALFSSTGTILFLQQTIPDRLKNGCGGPLTIATSGDGSHVWAANLCLEVFYKGPGQTSLARHEDESARMRYFSVSRSGNHVWGIGKSRRAIWYHPGQFGGTTGWRNMVETEFHPLERMGWASIGVSGIDGENVFASDGWGDLYYLNREGNDVKKENIPAPKTYMLVAYSLAVIPPEQLEFQGEWSFVGQNLDNVEVRAVTSWSTTEDQSITESFTWGLSQSISGELKTGFLLAGSKVTVTVGSSQEWGESVTNTVSQMTGEQNWYSCSSYSCANGRMWQWMIKGTTSSGRVETIKQCSFVCIPLESTDRPRCPPGPEGCGDSPCQCCNGDWAEGGNPPESPLCSTPNMRLGISTGNESSLCYGCD